MTDRPEGVVTFLFTDVQGSTRLWEQHPAAMRHALARHDSVLHQAISAHQGAVFKTIGDSFCAVFANPLAALHAALAAQQAFLQENWGELGALRVRMALHIGEAEQRAGDYFGPSLNRVARMLAAGHGGQILLSAAMQRQVSGQLPPHLTLHDLGEHRLKDLTQSEHLYQVLHPQLTADFPPLRSLEAFAHNLPIQLTSFIGREHELAQLKHRLGPDATLTSHLLTLVGVGGTGKTRLALQAAAEMLDEFPDGVWLVELAPLTDATLVPRVTANVLGVREEPGQLPETSLINYLRTKQALLILDNCEHLIQAAAQLAEQLLRACPQLYLLATSREALGVAGELTFAVSSLALPTQNQTYTAAGLMQYESVRLFAERAKAAAPLFALTDHNAAVIAQICARLDGIPLALELAAARVRFLSVEQIATRLSDRFRLLTGGSRTALPRQQTLQALIDWSYDLLADKEKRLLQRLAVFAGSWDLEAAEAVAGDAADDAPLPAVEVLEALAHLVDKSLVVLEDTAHGPRYRLLETIRQYARNKLLATHEVEPLRDRHLNYFGQLAQRIEPELFRGQQKEWLNRATDELDNLRAALEWSLSAESDDPAEVTQHLTQGLDLMYALRQFWRVRGHWSEARTWLAQLLEHPGSPPATRARARGLRLMAFFASHQSDHAKSVALHKEAHALARQLGDRATEAWTLTGIAINSELLGQAINIQADLEQSLAVFRELNDIPGQISLLSHLANWHWDHGHDRDTLDGVQALYEENLRLCYQIQHHLDAAGTLVALGYLFQHRQDLPAAQAKFEEALTIYQEFQDKSGINGTLLALANILLEREQFAAAQPLLAQGIELARELGNRIGLANAYNLWGEACRATGDISVAREYYQKCFTLAQESGIVQLFCNYYHNMAYLYLAEGQAALARQHFLLALQYSEQLGFDLFKSFCVIGLAWGKALQGQVQLAARLVGAAEAAAGPTFRLTIADRLDFARYWAQLCAQGDAEALLAARQAGRTWDFAQAVAAATAE